MAWDFDTLYESLRSLAESNAAEMRSQYSGSAGIIPAGIIQTWTLTPEQLHVLIEGIEQLKRDNLKLEATVSAFTSPFHTSSIGKKS